MQKQQTKLIPKAISRENLVRYLECNRAISEIGYGIDIPKNIRKLDEDGLTRFVINIKGAVYAKACELGKETELFTWVNQYLASRGYQVKTNIKKLTIYKHLPHEKIK